MKQVILLLSIFSLSIISMGLSAQEKESIKIKIIEETVDENGNVEKSEKVITGDEAKRFLEKNKSENEEIEIDVELDDQTEGKGRIIIKSKGEEKIIELDGSQGDVKWESDENIKMKIIKREDGNDFTIDQEENVFILRDNDSEDSKEKSYKIIIKDGDGETKVIKWDGEGDMPMEMKKQMHHEKRFGHKGQKIILKGDDEHIMLMPDSDVDMHQFDHVQFFEFPDDSDMNKAFLGVNIENGSKGVKIISFTENSAAKESGLLEGDEIFKVGKEKVRTMEELINALKGYNPGDQVKIKYFRKGKRSKVKAQLKERPKQKFELKSFDMDIPKFEVHPKHKNEKRIIIELEGEEMELNIDDIENRIEKSITIEIEKIEDEMELLKEELKLMEKELEGKEIEKSTKALDLLNFEAFPNPAGSEISLRFESKEKGDLMIEMVDLSGKWVNKEVRKNFTGKFEKRFDLSNAPKGNVIISITQNGKKYSHTIIVE